MILEQILLEVLQLKIINFPSWQVSIWSLRTLKRRIFFKIVLANYLISVNYFLALIYDGREKAGCGGAIISENVILTAGHCVTYPLYTQPPISVKVGHSNQFSTEIQEVSIDLIKFHEDFGWHDKFQFIKNDIALLKLSQPLKFDDSVSPICLPSEDTAIKDTLSQAGWGYVNSRRGLAFPEQLQFLDNLIHVPIENCSKEYQKASKRYDFEFDDLTICASGQLGFTDGCEGDSGGPLFQAIDDDEENMRYETIGIVSFGDRDCKSKVPAVYTKVTKYLSWIRDFVYENRP